MDNICEKPEAFAVSVEPNFAAYLHNEFLLPVQSRKEQPDLFLHRYLSAKFYDYTLKIELTTRAYHCARADSYTYIFPRFLF